MLALPIITDQLNEFVQLLIIDVSSLIHLYRVIKILTVLVYLKEINVSNSGQSESLLEQPF